MRRGYILAGAGGALVVGVLVAIVVTPKRRGAAGGGWVLLEDRESVLLERGRRYRGCVQVPFIVPTAMVESRLPSALSEKGFADVIVHRDVTPGWPDVDCDLYVEATWDRPDERMKRPGAVEFAWVRA